MTPSTWLACLRRRVAQPFYLNGQSINTGEINNIKIKEGDSIEAKYE